jgi:hypothetical protein
MVLPSKALSSNGKAGRGAVTAINFRIVLSIGAKNFTVVRGQCRQAAGATKSQGTTSKCLSGAQV